MRSLLLLLVLFAGCPRPPPVTPPPQRPAVPPLKVPEGCLADLSGDWVLAAAPSYRYRAVDDGGAVDLDVFRVFGADAGFVPRRFFLDGGVISAGPLSPARDGGASPADAGAALPVAHVLLRRAPTGFAGEVLAQTELPSGQTCVVRFEARVLSCSDGGLWLRAASAAALGEACQAPARPLPAPMLDHMLVRPDAGAR